MIATLSALVLGLLTASSKSALDGKQQEVRSMAAGIVELDRTLALYGPAGEPARAALKDMVRTRVAAIWPDEAGDVDIAAVSTGSGIEDVTRAILALAPANDGERWLQSQALSMTMSLAADRWTIVSQASSAIQWPFVAVVTFWLAIVFASFTMFAPKNASVAMAMLISGLSVAGAFYLIIEMDQPYSGLIRISSEPVRDVYAKLGAP
ncbi:MAG: DUF4239 domain-containing protein [Rhizobiales bacterium]|nr:DUF4239 domain-containing protein [Hyphomicrobiales bacterium]